MIVMCYIMRKGILHYRLYYIITNSLFDFISELDFTFYHIRKNI
jgi:hypothetical protein